MFEAESEEYLMVPMLHKKKLLLLLMRGVGEAHMWKARRMRVGARFGSTARAALICVTTLAQNVELL